MRRRKHLAASAHRCDPTKLQKGDDRPLPVYLCGKPFGGARALTMT